MSALNARKFSLFPIGSLRSSLGFLTGLLFLSLLAACDTKVEETAATLVSIQVTPPAPSIAKGTTQQFTATGTYSDGSTQNVTSSVSWSSANTAVATISATGLATGVTAGGPVTMTATSGGLSSTANLTVTAATLVSVQVTPPAPSIAAGTSQQFTATGTFTDFTTQDLTATAAWTSGNTAIATVAGGLATGVAVGGPATITATSGGISGTANLTVTAATLVSIQVTPPAPSIAKGTTQQFTATGTYSNFTTQNLTATATWGSSNTAIATVVGGLATGVTVGGPVTITATFGGISGTASLTVTAATLVSIQVTPASASIAAGTNQQFTATGVYSDFTSQNLTGSASWGSSDTAIATVIGGLATGVTVGGVTVTATSGAISGTATLTVTPALLVSIQVTPPSASIPKGTTQQFTAMGTYTDATTQNLTATASWGSSDTNVATVIGGLATGAAVGGAVTITATSGLISGTASLTVTPAVLLSIQVTPPNPSIPKGTTQQFTATGTYTDGPHDLTASASWASSDTAIATVVGGLATGGAVGGPVTITATFDLISGSASLTVTPATLVSIQVTPAVKSIAASTTQQFTAIGTYTDATTQDLTTSVSWVSNNTPVATVSSPGGLANGVTAGGPVTITATFGAISGTASLTVTAATVVSIQVTPPAPSIAAGTTLQFTATGTFSDATTQDVTALASWGSGDTGIATVLGGLATGVAPSTVTITATFGGVTSPAANLTVTNATLVSIQVTPASKSIAAGTFQQFTATGFYTDGSTQDLTVSAGWSSSNPTIAQSLGGCLPPFGCFFQGLVIGVAAGGPVTITATFGAISGTASLTVTPALLVSIAVTPSPASIAKGTNVQFTATGFYTDGNNQDLTAGASWGSGNTAIATVIGGLATGVTEGGPVNITATFGGISSPPASLTVTAAVLVSIAVTPPSASIAAGTTVQFTATGTYSDTTIQNLTGSASWSSSDEAVATVLGGLTTGVVVGGVTITATFDGVTSSPAANLTVTAATLVSIAVTPASASIVVGTTQEFIATGTYTDASTQDLTHSASWVSSDTGIATVLFGEATGVSAGGPVTITATSTGISGTANLTVTAVTNQGSPGSPFIIPAMPYNQGQVTVGGTSYYVFTTITPVNTINVTSITGGGVDPTVYTTADFLSPDLNWTCSAAAGNANDTCTSAGVPAGFTLYIGVAKSGGGSSTFTLSVQ